MAKITLDGTLWRNGTPYVGMAGASEIFNAVADRLILSTANAGEARCDNVVYALFGSHCKDTTARTSRIVTAFALWVNEEGNDAVLTPGRFVRSAPAATPTDAHAKIVREISEGDLSHAWTLVFAMKLNWYTSGHHTGQGKATGFFKKVLSAINLDAEEADIKALWRMGHWVDTMVILRALNIKGSHLGKPTPEGDAIMAKIEMPHELAMRADSFPAGTGKLAITATIGVRLSASAARFLMSPEIAADIQRCIEESDRVRGQGLLHHQGCKGLTGADRVAVKDPTGETLSAIASFAKVFMAKSTLASSEIIRNTKTSAEFDATLAMAFEAVCNAARDATESLSRVVSISAGSNALTKPHEFQELLEAADHRDLRDRDKKDEALLRDVECVARLRATLAQAGVAADSVDAMAMSIYDTATKGAGRTRIKF